MKTYSVDHKEQEFEELNCFTDSELKDLLMGFAMFHSNIVCSESTAVEIFLKGKNHSFPKYMRIKQPNKL